MYSLQWVFILENTTAIILAAGEGNRMDSCIPKVLCNVLEIPMIDWILDALDESNIKDKCVVVGYKAQEVVEHIGKRAVFAFQKERKGSYFLTDCGFRKTNVSNQPKNRGAERTSPEELSRGKA